MKTSNVKYKFTNRIVFAMVMEDKEICRQFLELVLPDRKVREIRFPELDSSETEKTLFAGISAKGVRLDVLFEDDSAWYDIEMQVQPEPHLARRVRYYQSMIDTHTLQSGQHYSKLKPSFVIFICLYDEFECDQSRYDVQSMIANLGLPFDDGRYTIRKRRIAA